MTERFDPTTPEPRRLRAAVGKSQRDMGALVGAPSDRTWQNWEADNSGSGRAMPLGMWELALLKTGYHPTLRLVDTKGTI